MWPRSASSAAIRRESYSIEHGDEAVDLGFIRDLPAEGVCELSLGFAGRATAMPALTRLTGLDEFGEDGPMSPDQVEEVRAMLPHTTMDPHRRMAMPDHWGGISGDSPEIPPQ